MAAALKDELGPALATALAGELSQAWPSFPRERFVDGLAAALEPLALMRRVDLLADRLVAAFPDDFPSAARVLWRALDSTTFTGWMTLPCGTYVTRAGIDHPHVALPLLAGLTPRFSSEGPIRPFIERHPAITLDYLRTWLGDPDEHVRRLVSEGTRPRLPWAPRIARFIDDPTPTIELLDRLVDDPSAYVRRSVANHLNDISKDHPDLALECARRWLPAGGRASWVVRHGLRTLIKRGNPEALSILGADQHANITLAAFEVDRERISIGDEVAFTITLDLRDSVPTDALIDYRVHYVGARGMRTPKVFKLARRQLEPGVPVTIVRRHRFEHVSIRRIHPGPHTIDIQVNGRILGSATLHVSDGAVPGASG
jgi:3-methyladenine DNA glycosylase AlkC